MVNQRLWEIVRFVYFLRTQDFLTPFLKKRFALFCSPEKKIEVLLLQKVDK